MRIAVFLLHLQHGGVERALSDLSSELIRQGHQVDFYVTYELGPPAYALDAGLNVHYLTRRRPNREAFHQALRRRRPLSILREATSALLTLWQKKRSFRRALRRANREADLLLCTRHEQNCYLAKVPRKALRIGQLHFDVPPDSALFKEIGRAYLGLDALTVLNAQQEEEFQALWRGEEAAPQVWSMPNFLPDAYFEERVPEEGLPRVEEGQPPSNPLAAAQQAARERLHLRAISVGRLEAEKGFDRLLEIWAAYLDTCSSERRAASCLELIGDGSCRRALEAQARGLGIAEQVSFCGYCSAEETRRRLAQAQIYLMCSRTEGFGIVLLEAASQGLPLLAYDVRSGPRSIIEDGLSGYLIPDGAQEVFVQRLQDLARQPELRERLGQEARRQCQRRFSAQALGRRWADLIAQLETGRRA